VIEHAANSGYLHRQVVVLDDGLRPDGGDDLVLSDDLARSFDKHAEKVERTRADRDREKRTAVAAPE